MTNGNTPEDEGRVPPTGAPPAKLPYVAPLPRRLTKLRHSP
jgi:hypothetical protein